MTKETMGDVEVTQADRDAAAKHTTRGHGKLGHHTFSATYMIRNGHWDDDPLVQAFARHRIEASRPAPSEASGDVVEAAYREGYSDADNSYSLAYNWEWSEARERSGLAGEITSYLAGGGLFNPELANHEAVRDLLIRCRDALTADKARDEALEEAAKELAAYCKRQNEAGKISSFTDAYRAIRSLKGAAK